MTVADLQNMSEEELDNLFNSMPEPKGPPVWGDPIDKIIEDFTKSKISVEDMALLSNDIMRISNGYGD